MKRIKTGDNIIVLAGKDKGATGVVTKVLGEKVLVEGVNMVKKHVKPNPRVQQPGGIIEKEAPLHISNVALLNPISKKADKVGFKFVEDADGGKQKKVRYFKSNNELVDVL